MVSDTRVFENGSRALRACYAEGRLVSLCLLYAVTVHGRDQWLESVTLPPTPRARRQAEAWLQGAGEPRGLGSSHSPWV
jgi:hypothetical protein